SRTNAVQVGLWIGIAALTKSAYVIALPLILSLPLLFHWRTGVRRLLPFALLTVLSYASVHSVWLVRNYVIAGEIVPFTTMNGFSFFVGNKIVDDFDINKQTAGSEPDLWADALYRSVQADIAATQPQMSMPRLEAQTDKQLIAMAGQLALAKPWFVMRKIL